MKKIVTVGTRESTLARWQTDWVVTQLEQAFPDISFRVIPVKTKGDKILDVALAKIGDKGLFTKELEVAILNKEIDFAVHSMKDLPTTLPDGLAIGANTQRHDPCDVIISHKGFTLATLPEKARVGTSSLRRKAQLLYLRQDLQICDLRGNLHTRLRKMEELDLDAILLAGAGVDRLGWENRIMERLPSHLFLPAVGQGAIGIEIRAGDQEIQSIVETLHHGNSALEISAERSLLSYLEGGCQIPIGALGVIENNVLSLDGLVADLDGKKMVRSKVSGPPSDAEKLGVDLAQRLLELGGDEILRQVRQKYDQETISFS
ncbi:MAG TPA: hydroxymethylbilane synthase [Clostridia bacterium]|nr:hydroxymethylbilane synthase [Clostridia bacterium]